MLYRLSGSTFLNIIFFLMFIFFRLVCLLFLSGPSQITKKKFFVLLALVVLSLLLRVVVLKKKKKNVSFRIIEHSKPPPVKGIREKKFPSLKSPALNSSPNVNTSFTVAATFPHIRSDLTLSQISLAEWTFKISTLRTISVPFHLSTVGQRETKIP